jgi:predicted PurR-regulated permease PerM
MATLIIPEGGGGPEEPRIYLPKGVSVAIIGTFTILLIGAVYYARSFFLPLILALLITLTFMPMVRYFHRRGVPPALTAVVSVLVVAGIGAAAAVLLSDPIARMVSEAPQIMGQLRERFAFLQRPIEMLSAAGREVSQLAEPAAADGTQKVVLAQPGFLSWAADTLTGIGTTLGATLLLSLFLLASGDTFLQKIVRSVDSLSDKKRSLRIVHDVSYEVSRYLLTITAINLCFGTLVGLAMAAYGMPNPVAWAVAATLLNYIPYIGAAIGIVLTAAVALISFPTVTMAILPPATYLALHLLEGSLITPLTLGRRLELNSVAILIAVAFGGWMWGVVGALVGVPLLVVVKVFCDHFGRLATFGAFLSAEPAAELPAPVIAEDVAAGEARPKEAGAP